MRITTLPISSILRLDVVEKKYVGTEHTRSPFFNDNHRSFTSTGLRILKCQRDVQKQTSQMVVPLRVSKKDLLKGVQQSVYLR